MKRHWLKKKKKSVGETQVLKANLEMHLKPLIDNQR